MRVFNDRNSRNLKGWRFYLWPCVIAVFSSLALSGHAQANPSVHVAQTMPHALPLIHQFLQNHPINKPHVKKLQQQMVNQINHLTLSVADINHRLYTQQNKAQGWIQQYVTKVKPNELSKFKK